jgi:hypothetical protein
LSGHCANPLDNPSSKPIDFSSFEQNFIDTSLLQQIMASPTESPMKSIMAILLLLTWGSPLHAAENSKYPAPRFPSYVKPPKSIDDIMPFARAAVRQTGGRTPLGLVEKGTLIGLVTEPIADDTVLQAIVRAYKERGVEARIIPEHELAGVNLRKFSKR